VLLLEHNSRAGKKIQISGGGRCNFTNLHATAENYLSAQPDFCKSALARYTPQDFIALVERHGIRYHEKKLGQQFCDHHANEIIEMLLKECQMAGVQMQTSCQVKAIRRPENFVVETSQGTWTSPALVIATGGLSCATLGATDFGYRVARQFGLAVTELRPGLVPLTFASEQKKAWVDLSGVSLPVTARHRGQSFTENLLVTHRGFSGPAILQISSYWREGETLEISLLPEVDVKQWLQEQRRSHLALEQILGRVWPQRFAKAWSQHLGVTRPLSQWPGEQIERLERELSSWQLRCAGTEGYPKAEVTLGGVATTELSSKTMEARAVPGLYFIGEVVDVTGWLGGYNFQWAWASAHAAGLAI
jgi:predicted Rossmann fold flavoprotein